VSVPVDADIRRRAVVEIRTSFAVSAGAGAGKTRVLVERLIATLAAGTPTSKVAAITFTEKAAGELFTRTRDALERHLAKPGSDSDRLVAALDHFGDLQIATIHSFCRALLEREALAAAWAPATEITGGLPDAALDELYRGWRRGFDRRHPTEAAWLRELTNETSPFPGVASVRATADALLENRDLTPLRATAGAAFDWSAAQAELGAIAAALGASAARCRNPDGCKLVLKTRPLQETLAALAALGDARAAIRQALALGELKVGHLGSKRDWDPADKEAMVGAVGSFTAWLSRTGSALGEHLHALLIEDLRAHYLPRLLKSRLQRGRADFADLLFRARRLLLEHPDARARLAARYDALLIDEVQDTDPIQAEVAALLARLPGATGHWESAPPRRGGLFAVGDPKQSIYRFRRADVSTWRRLEQVIARDGERLVLSQNFRSVPGIVAWVNHAFAGLEGYAPQASWRDAGQLAPVVAIEVDDPADEIDAAVAHLHGLFRDRALILDPDAVGSDSGDWRPIRPRAVMILLPSWTQAEAVRERLTLAGVESAVGGGEAFYKRDEIRLSLAAMRAIDEPRDAAAVALVLRGLFGLSFEDLAAHRAQNGSWDYTFRQPAGPVAEALDALRQLHRARRHRPWVALLDDLLARSGAPALWALTPRRWGILANLDKLRALIRQLEPESGSPGEVVERLQTLARRGAADLSTWDEHIEAVRITSIFKAKGLEAPVVVLVRAQRKVQSPTAVVDRAQDALATKAGSHVKAPGWEALEEMEKQARAEERHRWMYVAATRARDQLVVVRSPKSKLYPEAMQDALGDPAGPHDTSRIIAPGVEVWGRRGDALPPAPCLQETFPGLDGRIDQSLEAPAGAADAEAAWRLAQASAIAAARRASTRWRRLDRHRGAAWSGPQWGLAVHQAAQGLDPGRPGCREEALQRLRAATDELGLEDAARDRATAALEHLLDHPVLARARVAEMRLVDTPFLLRDRGAITSGRLDLCFPEDTARRRWVVVDWKTHLQRPRPDFLARYPGRLSRCAKALLAESTPCEAVDVVLLEPPSEAAPPEEDLDELLEDAHPALVDLLRALHAEGRTPELFWEVGEPRAYTQLEWAWPTHKLGLGLGLPASERARLEAEGWRVVHANEAEPGWNEEAERALRTLLGTSAP